MSVSCHMGWSEPEQREEFRMLKELTTTTTKKTDLETRNTSIKNVASKAVTKILKDPSHPVPTQTHSS